MNILDEVGGPIPRSANFGECVVTLKQALLSHQMLHDGCPVSDERECPPIYWSRVIDEQLINELQSTWKRLEQAAWRAGGELTLLHK